MNAETQNRRWTLQHVELLILTATLLTTVTISSLTLRQTTLDFELQRTSAFAERFDSEQMVEIREDVDRWLATGETPASLYQRCTPGEGGSFVSKDSADATQALKTVAELRTLANFFQEFGTALKFNSLNREYAHALLGGISIRYAEVLKPFITEMRKRRDRTQLYEEVYELEAQMQGMDRDGR